MQLPVNTRQPSAAVDPLFLNRRSPRAFAADPISPEQARRLFEAARWTPSCFNDQPWSFVYAVSEEGRARLAAFINEGNRSWAVAAPMLVIAYSRRNFRRTGAVNRWSAFDTGAACMALTLQAQLLGLATHPMGGILFDEVYKALDLDPEVYQVHCAIAVGKIGDPSMLPESVRARESFSDREPLESIVREL